MTKQKEMEYSVVPAGEALEEAILLACLNDHKQVVDIAFNDVVEADMYTPKNRDKWLALRKIWEENGKKPLPDTIFQDGLEKSKKLNLWDGDGGFEAFSLKAFIGIEACWVDDYTTRLKEYTKKRNASEVAVTILRAVENPGNNIDGVIEKAKGDLGGETKAQEKPDNGAHAPETPEEKSEYERLIQFVRESKPVCRGQRVSSLFFSGMMNELGLNEINTLPGAISIFRECKSLARECSTRSKLFSLSRDYFRMAGREVWLSLPTWSALHIPENEETRIAIKDSILKFLVSPRLYYADSSTPSTSSYGQWAAAQEEPQWESFENHPVYARYEQKDGVQIGVLPPYLMERATGLKDILGNSMTAGKKLKRYGLIESKSERSSIAIRHRFRCLRVWIIAREIVAEACGHAIENEPFETNIPDSEPENESKGQE